MSQQFCQIWLTCADQAEAETIANILLEAKLIGCAKQFAVKTDYLMLGSIETHNEVMMCMSSRVDLFDAVEKEVKKVHSYRAFLLEAVPVVKTARSAQKWLGMELDKGKVQAAR